MSASLTMDTPFFKRFLAWTDERFPIAYGILFFILYATGMLAGRMATTTGAIEIGVSDLLAFFPVWAFYFLLRAFDEHKDYEDDCQNYPDRILQRGLISLKHLKVGAAIAIGIQFAGALALDQGVGLITYAWGATFIYSLLMAKEFFIGEWLSKRLVLYAVSHMIVSPISMVWFAQVGAGSKMLPAQIGMLAGLSFLSGAAFEVTRKLRGKDEERDEVDSYSKVMGIKGGAGFVILVLIASAVVQGFLIDWILAGAAAWWWFALLCVGPLMAVASMSKFVKEPTEKRREGNEGAVSLAMLFSYVLVVAAIIFERGLTWV